jgi:glycerol uptake facilitator-like aquaporin
MDQFEPVELLSTWFHFLIFPGFEILIIGSRNFASGPLVPTLLGSLTNAFWLSLFILTTGPVSGGHLNPLITFSTFVGGLATFPRAILYVAFQITGSTIAGYLLHAAKVGPSTRSNAVIIPGCTTDTQLIPAGEALILETGSCLALIFLAFGIGLDPRQSSVYGPALGPIFIGLALGLTIFASGFLREGYTGASLNPARCFGLIAPWGGTVWNGHWIHWLGMLLASLINGCFYWLIPPSKKRNLGIER